MNSVKDAFNEVAGTNSRKKRLECLSSHCFQGEFNPVFHHLLASGDMEASISRSTETQSANGRNGSTDSSVLGGSAPAGRPLLLNGPNNLMKKKKRFSLGECLVSPTGNDKVDDKYFRGSDGPDDGLIGLDTEFRVVMNKNGLCTGEMGNQKVKKVWKKHVWVVLSMDLIICTILFVVWLCVCRGFKCVDS